MGIQIHTREFAPHVYGATRVTPQIKYLLVENGRRGRLMLIGENKDRIKLLRDAGLFNMPDDVQYLGHAMRRSLMPEKGWFSAESSDSLFLEYTSHMSLTRLVAGTSSEHAPLHNRIVSFDKYNHYTWLASKDFEMPDKPITGRKYFCLTHSIRDDVSIGWVEFDDNGIPKNGSSNVQLAIGGRPLVIKGEAAPLPMVLETFQADPRHLIRLPELDLNDGPGRFMPIGLITVQDMIRAGKAEELINKIRAGEPVLISLERERNYDPNFNNGQIASALSSFGYAKEDWELSNDVLYVKLRFNSYRHIFWASKGEDIIIGIILNDLAENNGRFDDYHYGRVMKSTGLSIPELQDFLINKLGVDNAVLMGSGKDSRVLVSEKDNVGDDERKVRIIADSDGRARTSAGVICLFHDR